MMFLQYAVLGVWGVTLPTLLMAPPHEGGLCLTGQQVGLLFGTFAIAAMGTPFVVGLLADRFFESQRLFAALHVCGAIALLGSFIFVLRQRDELCFQVTRVAMNEEVYGDTWRHVWEREGVLAYLRDPSDYSPGAGGSTDQLEHILRQLGLRNKPVRSHLHPNVWHSKERAEARLSELNQICGTEIMRIRKSGQLAAVVNRGWFGMFLLMMLIAMCYMPSLTLSNAISFRNLHHPARYYGHVRVFGTIGWMAAGIAVGLFSSPVSATPLLLGSWIALCLGLYAFTLPHTPPEHTGKTLGELFGLRAIQMFARLRFRCFVITSVVITMVTAFHNTYLNRYLVDLGVAHAAAWQTTGQVTEIICILALPFMRLRVGLKRTLCLGLAASLLRFAIYAAGNVWLLLSVGIPLQGVCYAFYFIAAMLFVDRHAPRTLRASAQGLLAICTSGFGAFVGNWLAGSAVDRFLSIGGVAWQWVWTIPALGSLAAIVYFAWRFREPPIEVEAVTGSA